jgi:glycosyltransferase involved in cell wall biosynthesis
MRELDKRIVRAWLSGIAPKNRERIIVWLYDVHASFLLDLFPRAIKVYDCVDDFAAFSEALSDVPEEEQRVLANVDLVLVTSEPLREQKAKAHPRCYVVRNGADVDHFAPARGQPQEPPEDLRSTGAPRIGYVGAIHDWIDLDLIVETARLRPAYSFVFVGPVGPRVNITRVRAQRNIILVGRKAYDELPAYLGAFDACIAPFRRNALTEAVNPIKVYEYLATGKPVVATPIPELAALAPVVSLASTAEEFASALDRASQEANSEALIARRLEVARANSWDARLEQIRDILAGVRSAA